MKSYHMSAFRVMTPRPAGCSSNHAASALQKPVNASLHLINPGLLLAGSAIASQDRAGATERMKQYVSITLFFLVFVSVCPSLYGQALTNDAYTINQGESLVVDGKQNPGIFENDAIDPDLSSVTARISQQPEHGSLVFNENGRFTYQPDPNFSGDDVFSYWASVAAPVTVLSSRTNWRAFSPVDGTPPALDIPNFDEVWSTLAFEVPRSWVRARGLVGYGQFGDSQNNGVAGISPGTSLALPINGRRYTGYVRTVFRIAESGVYRLNAIVRRDDGVIAYLDGQELFRSFEPGAMMARLAPAGYFLMVEGTNTGFAFGPGEIAQNLIEIDAVELAAGDHCFGFSMHNARAGNQQNGAASSDLGVQLDALRLTRVEQAEVAITVLPAPVAVTGQPDWFSTRIDEILDTNHLQRSLYTNDNLLDEDGVPFQEILDLEIDDSQAEGTITGFDLATGNFQFQPTEGFEGVTTLSYRVTTAGGVSEPIGIYIWIASSVGDNGVSPRAVSIAAFQSNIRLPLPDSIAIPTVVTQPAIGSVRIARLGGASPGWYGIYSRPSDLTYTPRAGADQFVVEFLPLPTELLRVRLPVPLNLMSPMEAWRTRIFNESQLSDPSTSGALSDPDNDDYSNMLEYIFNTNPLDSVSRPSIPLEVTANGPNVGVTTFLQTLPPDAMCELQLRGQDDVDWITIGASYGHLNAAFQNGWYTNIGRGNQSILPRERVAALYRYRFSLYPWVTDIPEGPPVGP